MPLKRSLNLGSGRIPSNTLGSSVTPSAAKSGSFMAFWPEIMVDHGGEICYTMYIVRK
jgi:hypothetical protein